MQCGICFESFNVESRTPMALPCQHTFCKPCVLRFPSVPGRKKECPMCRSRFSPDTAKVNHGLKDALASLNSRGRSRTPPRQNSQSHGVRLNADSQLQVEIKKGTIGTIKSIDPMEVNWSPHPIGVAKVLQKQVQKLKPEEYLRAGDVVRAIHQLSHPGNGTVQKGDLGTLISATADGSWTVKWNTLNQACQSQKSHFKKCDPDEYLQKGDAVKATKNIKYGCATIEKGVIGTLTSCSEPFKVDWGDPLGNRQILRDQFAKCKPCEFLRKGDIVKARRRLQFQNGGAVEKNSLGTVTETDEATCEIRWSPALLGKCEKSAFEKCDPCEFLKIGDAVKALVDINVSASLPVSVWPLLIQSPLPAS
eukprot:TRINITY_DN111284_c0_g1_i1.p1 TRINITY_DN111284_c0_g1~~TRINITY_DN111284_c0_g1_i1.p1  ORF type:complete len:364 (+),score=51.93 TRINITY_DN111284_c0_g1_i1:69-1160(+)